MLILAFDQEPASLPAWARGFQTRPDQHKSTLKFLSTKGELQFALRQLLCCGAEGISLVSSFVPNHHRSGAVLALRNDAFKIGVLNRVVLRLDGQTLVPRI